MGPVCMSSRVRASRQTSRARGFTLIELMVVIIIIGVVAALATAATAAARIKPQRVEATRVRSCSSFARRAARCPVARGENSYWSRPAFAGDRPRHVLDVRGRSGSPMRRAPARTPSSLQGAHLVALGPANAGVVQLDGLNLNGAIQNRTSTSRPSFASTTPQTAPCGAVSEGFLCFTRWGCLLRERRHPDLRQRHALAGHT